MLTLFYSPGACSMAAHVVLEEVGADYRPELVLLTAKQQLTEEYRAINPRARVPSLRLDDGSVLTECSAIMVYAARRYPQSGMLPKSLEDEAKCLSLLSFFASSVHVAYSHVRKPERYADDEIAFEAMRRTNTRAFHNYLIEIDGLLAGREWFCDTYSCCDPYTLVFYRWGLRLGLPLADLPALTAHKDRLLERPAVQRMLKQEDVAID